MKRLVIILFSLFFVQSATASQGQDLNQIMKNMGHAYKQAMEATEAHEINKHLDTMLSLLKQSEQHNFKTDVKAESLQGLQKVADVIEQAQNLLTHKQIHQAKQRLKEVDLLRKEYHKLHEPPGFWELLFGK